VDGPIISSFGRGFVFLVGLDKWKSTEDTKTMVKKILSIKLFDSEEGGMWKRDVRDIQGDILCVSQFTLFANFKGSKPDFHESMSTIPGKSAYTSFLEHLRNSYDTEKVQDGKFGAMMQVSLVNDGPVTINLDTRSKKSSPTIPQSSTAVPKSASSP
ncbi:hypothetical protein TREMEDRAFT_18262, partial [Tremella mesenterica DSM 1558]|uniref:uncharacterized protein n=1 Tax=Tremella mesenterica (strain ATCC 24925 / CBS 8224 / DSM 1558 / NBRC 9311 / NRRL Y-6157 / RJB 2259-6 / UBC 559-6) TaxID=578456 RepID=UPI0003F49AAB